jgi:hypothetical protein
MQDGRGPAAERELHSGISNGMEATLVVEETKTTWEELS